MGNDNVTYMMTVQIDTRSESERECCQVTREGIKRGGKSVNARAAAERRRRARTVTLHSATGTENTS